MAVALGRRTSLVSGPWKSVYNTTDPYDAAPNTLVDAQNGYIPDPENGSGFYARPGFVLGNAGNPVYSSATAFRGQGVFSHYGLDGLPVNFVAFGGHLFRVDATLSVYTDVTPVGVAIDGDIATRVYFADLGGVMAVTDGVHRPWVASDLAATPITGTYIDFDGMGTAWVAYGPPVVYGDAGFFVLTSVNGVAARIDIAWCEPNDWTTGYQQTDFDNRWTLEQTGTQPIYGLAATNVALYYLRQRSIGAISGTVGIDLATTATHDAVSSNVGTQSPQTIVLFNNTIYFTDVIGRPWKFTIGSAPTPIWHQLRAVIDVSQIAFPAITAQVSTATFDPTLNLYAAAIWSPTVGDLAPPTEWQSFDAETGNYGGRWSVNGGISVDCLGSLTDNNGRGVLVVLGSATVGGATGYLWTMNSLTGVVDFIGTEDLTILTTEDTASLTIEGQAAIWKDNGQVPTITATTDRLGYAADIVWLYDQATVIAGSAAPVALSVTTPNAANVIEGTASPITSADGMYRSACGLDLQGRGASVTISPTTAEVQWNLQRVTVVGIPSLAMPDDA